ncbi:hypothetical protein L7F22_062892 [Adiantum nelumboides]|nr:hypothetical protein [Adiantum nelumboides]
MQGHPTPPRLSMYMSGNVQCFKNSYMCSKKGQILCPSEVQHWAEFWLGSQDIASQEGLRTVFYSQMPPLEVQWLMLLKTIVRGNRKIAWINVVSFVGILRVCGSMGATEKGQICFDSINNSHGMHDKARRLLNGRFSKSNRLQNSRLTLMTKESVANS